MLTWLESTEVSAWVRGESLWGWPIVLTLHVIGTALAIGLIFVISLRMLGLFETISYTALRRLFPAIWIAFALQFLTGFVLWMTKPTRYVADTAFLLKFALVVVGVVLTSYFYVTMKRNAATWDAAGTSSSRGVKYGTVSLLVWCGVIVTARLTALL